VGLPVDLLVDSSEVYIQAVDIQEVDIQAAS
jgi:hypothetical protein